MRLIRPILLATVLGLAASCLGAGAAEKIQIALPVYAGPGDPYLTDLLDPAKTPEPPALVVFNVANGDGNVAVLDASADALRARTTASGEHVKVLGYVYTGFAKRSDSAIKKSINRYLTARNGSIHYDGIFFDEGVASCGPSATSLSWRNKYRTLREYVNGKFASGKGWVVNNIGTAVASCYLASGMDTADIFITFEDTAEHYLTDAISVGWAYGWVGGNVIENGQYTAGSNYGAGRFWHLVYKASTSNWATVIGTAQARGAGYVDATDDNLTDTTLNPWDAKPSFLNEAISYSGALSP